MTSVSIVREKETGTMEVLLVSPVRPIRIVFAKMIPYFVLSCLNLASILLLARFVLGVPMSGGIVGIVGLSLLYIVLALALGLFISTVARTQVTAPAGLGHAHAHADDHALGHGLPRSGTCPRRYGGSRASFRPGGTSPPSGG